MSNTPSERRSSETAQGSFRRARISVHAALGLWIGLLVGWIDGGLAADAEGLPPLLDGVDTAAQMLSSFLLGLPGLVFGVLLGVLLWFLTTWSRPAQLWRWVRASPKRRLGSYVLVVLGAGGFAAFVSTRSLDWDAIDWTLPWLLAGAGCLWLVAALLLRMVSLRWILSILAVGVGLFSVNLNQWHGLDSEDGQALERVATETRVAQKVLLRVRTSLFDGDGDGFPTQLCRLDCDCDDANLAINPDAHDVPANGIDEDCSGEDAKSGSTQDFAALLKQSEDSSLGERQTGSPQPAQGVKQPRDAADGEAVGQTDLGSASQDLPGIQASTAQDGPDSGPTQGDGQGDVAQRAPDEGGAAAPSLVGSKPNILLITVDTLRADHLGCYGYERPVSPHIDAWAKGAVVFDQARSTGPATRFSIPPMLTSKYFTEIARTEGHWPKVKKEEVLMAERLKEAGYHTAAFHSISYLKGFYGFDQGFDHYDVTATKKRTPLHDPTSDMVTDRALAYAQEGELASKGPWLLWAYYGDPHSPYLFHKSAPRFGPKIQDNYDNEIAFTDMHIGRLLEGLEARGLLDNTLVMLTSDHGEALYPKQDHGHRYHSANLYDELVRVPLIVSGPGVQAGRVKTPVSLVDVLPTFTELAGLGVDPAFRGLSLLPWLRGENPVHPPVFFEKHRRSDAAQKGMVWWPYKVIVVLPFKRYRVFNLEEDPRETKNLYKTLPAEERDRLIGMLTHWRKEVLKPVKMRNRN